MNGRAFGTAIMVLAGLCLLTVALNAIRWDYTESGIGCVDRWTGKAGLTSEMSVRNHLLDTGRYVFGAAGVVLALAAVVGWVTRGVRAR